MSGHVPRRSARLARAPEPCSISTLPEAALGRILELAGDRSTIGPVACQVSKHWRSAVFCTPSFWRHFRLHPEYLHNLPAAERQSWLEVRRRVLERVGGCVTSLSLEFDAHGAAFDSHHSIADYLRLLLPARLSELHLRCTALPAAVAEALRSLTGLTTLSLSVPQLDEGYVRHWLAALARLEQLSWNSLLLPPWLPAALSALPALRSLSLRCAGSSPFPEALAQLAGLAALACLRLETAQPLPEAAAQLSGLTALTALTIRCVGRVAGTLPEPSQFAALQRYSYTATRGAQIAGAEVCRVECGACEHGAALELVGVERLPSLARLLDALVPSGAAALASLAVRQARLEAAAVAHCARLSSLTRLSLDACDTPWHQSDVPAVVGTLLPAAPRLVELRLEACSLREVPACVADMRGLTRLDLTHNRLRKKMPKGAYLKDLEELDVSWNSVGRLPVALKQAPALRRLSLHGNDPVDGKDIEGVLARMPALEWLDLGNTGTTDATLKALHARLPRLSIQLSSRRCYP